MRGMISSLNMFLLDYLIVPIWMVFSVLGNRNSARIMIPVTFLFLVINYLNTRSATKLFFLDINLAAASVAGIILNTFLYIKFVYADPQIITDMVALIFIFTLSIIAASILFLAFKSLMHRRNMRIISRMAEGAYDEGDEDEDDGYEEDEDDDEDEDEDSDEDDDDEDDEEGTGFLTSISNLLKSREEEDEEEEEEEEVDDEEDDDGYEKPDGPKFRVVKK